MSMIMNYVAYNNIFVWQLIVIHAFFVFFLALFIGLSTVSVVKWHKPSKSKDAFETKFITDYDTGKW